MNSGVLQFSLGLATGGFLNPLNSTIGKLTGFIGSFISLGAISAGVMSAIERGAALEHLSKRTDTSVADLFKLQKGFKAVGIDADAVGGILFKMQKSLGGVNEYGVDTRSIFHRMGLSITDLKKMNAPQQLAAIAAGLGKLNTTGAANAAGGIFGREGAQQMVQLSRSTGEFGAAMRAAQRDADNMQRNAASFARIERGLVAIKDKAQGLFAGIAEGLAPGIQLIEDSLNGIDLTQLGQKLGKIITAFGEAFREGKLTELIALAISTGFKAGFTIEPALYEQIGYGLLEAFKTPLEYLQAGLTWVEEKFVEWIAYIESKLPKPVRAAIGYNEGMTGYKADTFSQILQDRKDRGLEIGLVTLKEIGGQANKDLQNAIGKMQTIFAPFNLMVDGLAARAPKAKGAGAQTPGNSGAALDAATSHYKPEVTAFEKMGFVMGGGANPMLDLNRRTATGVEKTVNLLTSINRLLGGAGAGGAVNQI
jgi:hypothetical protein